MVSSKDYIGRIANQNDLIRVSLIKKAQITNESQKKILKKYEEYNQKKAKEFKEKQREKSASVSINNNKQQNNSSKNHDQTSQNSSFTEINESDDSLDSLSNIKKKQKIENKQSEDEDDEDQHIFYTIKCKFILSFEKVYIDVWDQFNQENIKFSLCQEETLDDLKTAIEEIIGIEQEKIQIASEVYIHEKLYDFDQLNINYELFNKKTSTLQFFQRQVGG